MKQNTRFDSLKSANNDGFIEQRSRRTRNRSNVVEQPVFLQPKKLKEPKEAKIDLDMFPALSTKEASSTHPTLNFGSLFLEKDEALVQPAAKIEPGWIKLTKHAIEKGDMTQHDLNLKLNEKRQFQTNLKIITDKHFEYKVSMFNKNEYVDMDTTNSDYETESICDDDEDNANEEMEISPEIELN